MQTSNRIIRQAKMLYTVQNASLAKYVIIPKKFCVQTFPINYYIFGDLILHALGNHCDFLGLAEI